MIVNSSDLEDYRVVDTAPSEQFTKLTKLALKICNCEIAFISLFDFKQDRQWFKAIEGIEISEFPLSESLCLKLVNSKTPYLYLSNLSEAPELEDNSFVSEYGINFYASYPLVSGGKVLGSFCVAGRKSNELDKIQLEFLSTMAEQAMNLIESYCVNQKLLIQSNRLQKRKAVTEKASIIGKLGGVYVSLKEEDILWTPSNNVLFELEEDYSMSFTDFQDQIFLEQENLAVLFSKLKDLINSSKLENSNFTLEMEIANKLIKIYGEISDGELFASFHDDSLQRELNHELQTYKVLMEQVEELVNLGGWSFNVHEEEVNWTKNVYAIYELPVGEKISIEKAISFYEADSKTAMRNDLDHLVNSGIPYHSEYLLKSSSGKMKWISANGYPVYSNSKLIKVVGSIQDVTAEKLLNEKLMKSEHVALEQAHYYKSLVNNQSFFVCKLDPSGQLLFCNELYMKKFKKDSSSTECVGENFFNNISSESLDRYIELFTNLYTGTISSLSVSVSHTIAHGAAVIVHWDFTGLKDAEGKVTEVLCLGYNISELEESKAKVQYLADYNSFQNKKIISYNTIVSHNIRSHVANSLGLLNLMDYENNGLEHSEYFKLLKREVRKLDKTIITLDKITSARAISDSKKKNFLLFELVEGVFETLNKLFPEIPFLKHNSISKDLKIFSIQENLNDILLQLFIYCFKNGETGRQLEFGIDAISITDNITQIEIVDNGAGIEFESEEMREFKIVRSLRSLNGNKKINLKFIEDQVEILGGKIVMKSDVGVGTRITIELINHEN